MAAGPISGFNALAGASVDPAADVLPIVDTSATETKKITVAELRKALATTVGQALMVLATPGAAAYLRINPDGTVDELSAADFKTALSIAAGIGGSTGSVSDVLLVSDGMGGVTLKAIDSTTPGQVGNAGIRFDNSGGGGASNQSVIRGTGGGGGILFTCNNTTQLTVGYGTGCLVSGTLYVGSNIILGISSGSYTALSMYGTVGGADYNLSSSPSDTNLYVNRPAGKDILFLEANSSTSLTIKGTTAALVPGGPVRLKGYTVGTLPSGTQGDTAFVTDALAPTFLATVVGGGAIKTPVFFDGTNWIGG